DGRLVRRHGAVLPAAAAVGAPAPDVGDRRRRRRARRRAGARAGAPRARRGRLAVARTPRRATRHGHRLALTSCLSYTNGMSLERFRRIVVLTGAGISKSAGLATYRGPGGLWSDPKLEELSHVDALVDRRTEVTDMFWRCRGAIAGAEP